MTRRPLFNIRTIGLAALLVATMFATPQFSDAVNGDCGQPLSDGANPTASDALFILNVAVGLQTCALETCDINGNCAVTASDSLQTLNKAVGVDIPLLCNCGDTTTTLVPPTTTTTMGPERAPCSSALFFAKAGSDLDAGWKGPGHNSDIIEGASITFAVLRRCSNDQAECIVDSDCDGGTCDLTCYCDGSDTECEVTGPTSPSSCITDTSITCTTNADCEGAGDNCLKFFGPPLPLVASGVPTCITSYFQGPISGTADSSTGEGVVTAALRSRVHLGINIETPCPRCGEIGVAIGDSATCEGGINNGAACTVEALSPDFGGVSATCPPEVNTNVSGVGLNIRFNEVTTGTVSKLATLPCGPPFDTFHPDSGSGLCLDDFTDCTSNADCTTATCGLYCHCGFCDAGSGADLDLPCFNDEDCDEGSTCSSDASDSNLNQAQPNGCESLLCGEVTPEQCCIAGEVGCDNPTPLDGECNGNPNSCANNSECALSGNGDECIFTPRPCFDSTITRQGVASPLGKYCTNDPDVTECDSNSDCAIGDCVEDSSEPTTAALFCIPATASPAINAAAGTPGPGAIEFRTVLVSCRCGDGVVGCDEECDEGDMNGGVDCDQACRLVP